MFTRLQRHILYQILSAICLSFIWVTITFTLAFPEFIAYKFGLTDRVYSIYDIYLAEKELFVKGILVLIILVFVDTFIAMFRWGLTVYHLVTIFFLCIVGITIWTLAYNVASMTESSFATVFIIEASIIFLIKCISLVIIYETQNNNHY